MALIASLIFGFVPMFIFAGFVNWLDRYEKEPKFLLGVVFFWGALVAAGGAYIINTLFGVGVYLATSSEIFTEIATGSLIAPIVEELLKGFAVLIVFLIFRQEFDSILDGAIYAAITALGFAATENVFYIYNYGYMESGWEGLFSLVFIRVILVGWQHPFYTAFFGIGLAIARLNRNVLLKIIPPIAGLGMAMLTHSLHNTISPFLISSIGLVGMAVSSMLDWSGWLAMFFFLVIMVFREKQLLMHHLKEEFDNGILTENQYLAATSLFGQSLARLKAFSTGNFRPVRNFFQLCGELAHKKQQLHRMGEEKGNTALIDSLRKDIQAISAKVSL